MRRFFISVVVLLVLGAVSEIRSFALTEEEVYISSGADRVLPKEETEKSFAERVLSLFSDLWQGTVGGVFKHCGLILACLVVLALGEGLGGLRGEKINAALDFASGAALAAACFPALQTVFEYTKASVEGFCAFGVSLLPVNAALYSMGGSTAEAVAATSGVNLFLTLTETVCAKLLLPVLSMGFAFALTGLLPGATTLAPLASFIKNVACTLITFTFSLVCFVFYFQSAIAASADGFAYRSIKFASGAFIPLIGNAVGDSARTVFGAVSSVKATVGAAGLTVMLGYILPPLVSAVLYKLGFAFCAVAARLCGLEKQARFVGELSSMLGVSMALLIATAVVFTVISAVFLKSGVAA